MTDHISDKVKKPYIKPAFTKRPLCGKIIKTVDNNRLPCLRPSGHEDGCNPFSDTPPPKSNLMEK